MNANPYQTYKQQSVLTMTPGQVLLYVYDELIKQINFAKLGFEDNDINLINRSLQKSQKIIHVLQSTLNYDYSISNNLYDLYDYFNFVLINSNMKKDTDGLDDVLSMVVELRKTFAEADKLSSK